jgi:hypothetical protein
MRAQRAQRLNVAPFARPSRTRDLRQIVALVKGSSNGNHTHNQTFSLSANEEEVERETGLEPATFSLEG